MNAKERLEDAREKADFAFWAEVAKCFPEIRTGDMAPEIVFEMHEKMKEWIALWLHGNGDFPMSPEDYEKEHLCSECGEVMVAAGVNNCAKCAQKCPLCGCDEAHACEDGCGWVHCVECKRVVCSAKKCAVQSPYGGKWLCQDCNQKHVKEVVEMDKKNQAKVALPLNTWDEDSHTGDAVTDGEMSE